VETIILILTYININDNWLNLIPNALSAREALRIMTYDYLPDLETASGLASCWEHGGTVKHERVYPCMYTRNSPSFGRRIFQINFYLPSIVPENWGLLDSR